MQTIVVLFKHKVAKHVTLTRTLQNNQCLILEKSNTSHIKYIGINSRVVRLSKEKFSTASMSHPQTMCHFHAPICGMSSTEYIASLPSDCNETLSKLKLINKVSKGF